jgi:hypothetical protein
MYTTEQKLLAISFHKLLRAIQKKYGRKFVRELIKGYTDTITPPKLD